MEDQNVSPAFLGKDMVKTLISTIKTKVQGIVDKAVKALKDTIVGGDGKVKAEVLPVATADAVGAVKAGTGITIGDDGTISANGDGVTAITEAELTAIFAEAWPDEAAA